MATRHIAFYNAHRLAFGSVNLQINRTPLRIYRLAIFSVCQLSQVQNVTISSADIKRCVWLIETHALNSHYHCKTAVQRVIIA